MELQINKDLSETNTKYANSFLGNGVVQITPEIDEDYWIFKVKVSEKQAVIGFPKFGTIGIGFQKEVDWNTNLPYTCDTMEIYNHIKHNKGGKATTQENCIAAIKLIQDACYKLKGA